MPKSKTKSKPINYNKIAIELKGKTSFTIDLRKTDKNPSIKKGENTFTPAEKRALTIAAKAYKEYKGEANFIPIRKGKKESKSAFKERLNNTRKGMGQSNSGFAGVWVDTPNFAKVIKRRIKDDKGKWITDIQSKSIGKRIPLAVGFGRESIKEKHVAIDPHLFSVDPRKCLLELKAKFPKADRILPNHSGFRGKGTKLDDASYNRFIYKMINWAYKYNDGTSTADHWLTGFIIVNYAIIPEKGAKTEKQIKKQLNKM